VPSDGIFASSHHDKLPLSISKRKLGVVGALQKRSGERDRRATNSREADVGAGKKAYDTPPNIIGDLCFLLTRGYVCGLKNAAAVALGRLAKGKAKRLTEAERERRREWMRQVNERRRKKKSALC